jgi:hypothetical protein
MSAEPQRKVSVARAANARPSELPVAPVAELEHLLKVTGSVSQDANQVWAEMWSEFKRMATGSGEVMLEAKEGFVPACGWPEFLEKFWLLKHYLDSIQRICDRKQ